MMNFDRDLDIFCHLLFLEIKASLFVTLHNIKFHTKIVYMMNELVRKKIACEIPFVHKVRNAFFIIFS